jgi:hypothetical protein
MGRNANEISGLLAGLRPDDSRPEGETVAHLTGPVYMPEDIKKLRYG